MFRISGSNKGLKIFINRLMLMCIDCVDNAKVFTDSNKIWSIVSVEGWRRSMR